MRGLTPDPFKSKVHFAPDTRTTMCGRDADKVNHVPPRAVKYVTCKRCLAALADF